MTSGTISRIREFNRFYTQAIGLIKKRFLDSEFSLIQARVLFELHNSPDIHAKDLSVQLDLDVTYLSKILKKFDTSGLLLRQPSPEDSRKYLLRLSPEGEAQYAKLRDMSNLHILGLIKELPPEDQDRLVSAMTTVETLLSPGGSSRELYMIRPHRPGDIGYVIHRHGVLYAREYGFNEEFDAYVAEGMAGFIKGFDPTAEHLWIAESDGIIVGSVAIVRRDRETAQLRWLFVEPSERRRGIAGKLVEEAVVFARKKGYARVILWTIDFLHGARALYTRAGFALTETKESRVWGKTLNEEKWELHM
jgi:DNA-binding MarR family transcriptional regulator/GNAT superfamily N-acetyltransferase